MSRKPIKALLASMFAIVLSGLLFACANNASTKDDATQEAVVNIDITNQIDDSGIPYSNYIAVLNQTPEQWDALSDEEKLQNAKTAFDAVVAKIEADGESSYNILGIVKAGEFDPRKTVFSINLETSTMTVYSGVNGSSPTAISEEAVVLPFA